MLSVAYFLTLLLSIAYSQLFTNQLLYDFDVFGFIPRLVTKMDVSNHAISINHDGARHRLQVIQLTHLLAFIYQYWKGDFGLVYDFLSWFRIALDIDAEHGEPRVFITIV